VNNKRIESYNTLEKRKDGIP